MKSIQRLATAIFVFALAVTPTFSQTRRPMTFEDLMKMRRLGDIDLSRDGKWVLFSATDVDLEKNTRTSHLWIVPTTGGKETALTDSLTGESRGRFSPDGKQILFLSPREGGQQIYLADFDAAAGTIGEAHKLTSISTEADGATWSPDGQNILFTSSVYPDCSDDACNKQRDDERAASKVKAQIFTSLLYRHWNALRWRQAQPSLPRSGQRRHSPRPQPRRHSRSPAILPRRPRRLRLRPRRQRDRLRRKPRPRARDQHPRRHLHAAA